MQNDPPSSRSITLHFSPFGSRSGLVRYSKNGKNLCLLVVPRFWRSIRRYAYIAPDNDNICFLIVKECDKVKFENIPIVWANLLESCVDWLDKRQADSNDQEKDSDDMNPELQKSFYKLITISSGNTTKGIEDINIKKLLEKQNESLEKQKNDQDDFNKYLMALFLLESKMKPNFGYTNHPEDLDFRSFVHEGLADLYPFRVFVFNEFVRLVELKKHFIRQGYVTSEDRLPCIRGRLTTQGLVRWIATKIPEFQCEYDDFTPAIPLFQVVVTALEKVADGPVFTHSDEVVKDEEVVKKFLKNIQEKAMRLRRSLAYIPSLPKPVAAGMAGRLKLPRIFSTWSSVLDMARIILQDLSLDLRANSEGESGIFKPVKTPAIWEKILEKFATQADITIKPPFKLNRPWVDKVNEKPKKKPKKNPKPDLDVIYTSGDSESRHIMDAKYKAYPGDKLPSMADQYQMFAYSLLLKKGEDIDGYMQPKSINLIYPLSKNDPAGNADEFIHKKIGKRSSLKFDSNSTPTPILCQASFRFPDPEDIIYDDKWDNYLANGKDLFLKLFQNNPNLENQNSAGTTPDIVEGK